MYEQFIGTPVAVANTQLCAIFYVVDNVRCSSSAIHFEAIALGPDDIEKYNIVNENGFKLSPLHARNMNTNQKYRQRL